MKKKVLAALCAGAMLCGMVSAPVSAWETKYSKGDVNMDGEIDGRDVTAALAEYTWTMLLGEGHYLTEEQIELADIRPGERTKEFINRAIGETYEITSRIDLRDAWLILAYYTYGMVDETVRDQDIVEFAKEIKPNWFEK